MDKLFLYDTGSTTPDTLTVMKRKDYTCIPLTHDPDVFWSSITNLDDGGIFVLLSHGDKDGPLAVEGDEGEDIDLERFSRRISDKNLTLYLLSCHTGLDPCGSTLINERLTFVAPKGYAIFQTIGSDIISVTSEEDGKFPGWVGPLSPNRANKALSLP